MRSLPIFPLLVGALLLLAPTPALARGGRYSGPGGSEPATPSEPDAPEAKTPTAPPVLPTPGTGPSVAPPTATAPAAATSRTRPGRPGAKAPGAASWTRWYDANRERYEDLRARQLFTETSPVFSVGAVSGPDLGGPAQHLAPQDRTEVLRALHAVLERPEGHWIHTQAAALVALGKVAERPADLAPHFRLLAPEPADSTAMPAGQEYLKESAILGLANLRREREGDHLSATLLDRVRDVLFAVLENDGYRPKTRGHAALALGLLAAEPSHRNGDGARFTARRLFELWIERDLDEEVQVGLLLGLARVEPSATTKLMRLVLGGCATRGGNWPNARSGLVRAHALLTLARLGEARDANVIVEMLDRGKDEHTLLRQAAPLAAAVLGERVPAVRGLLGASLLEALDAQKEPASRRLALVGVGRLLADEAASGDAYLLLDRKAGRRLLEVLEDGGQEEKPFAALALALVVRGLGKEVPTAEWSEFKRTTIQALRKTFATDEGDVAARGAYALALGVAGDGNSVARLLELLSDEDRAPEARAYAALGLGLLGDGRREIARAVVRALADPRSDVLQSRAATALGLLGDGDPDHRARQLEALVREMRGSAQPYVKGQIAITLGRIGDGRAVKSLVEILENPAETQLNRAMACAALGLLGEKGLHPALAPARWDAHYLSSSALVYDVLDVL